jgi:basic amino acid/polyamine antiporter, APA family
MGKANDRQEIGIYITTSLVVGGMIGSGIFMLPASMAKLGSISLLGWVISGLGALLIAIVFSRLSKLVPLTGGPYVFPKEGFGDFIGFLSGWGYWLSILLTNASIALVFTGYLLVFIPGWSDSSLALILIPVTAIWTLTWVNSLGVKSGGFIQLTTTILKVIPLIIVTIAGFFFFEVKYFTPFNTSGSSDLVAIGASITLTLFAFLGVETATIPAGNIKNPEVTIPRATIIGTVITIIIYLMSSVSIMGMLPQEQLANSSAPFAEAAEMIWGTTGKYLVGIGALISTFGALNCWILLQGFMPLAMAEDNLLPPLFKRKSKSNYPVVGLVISSIIVTIVVVANSSSGLVAMFTLLILVTTFLTLISYLFSSLAEVLILIKHKPPGWEKRIIRAFILGLTVFAFSVIAVYGAGMKIVFYGFIVLILGVPFYVWSKIKQNQIS